MDEELDYSRYDYKDKEVTNSRNGHHQKTLKTEMGNIEIQVPQDTEGEFEPQIVPKYSKEISPAIQDVLRKFEYKYNCQRMHQSLNYLILMEYYYKLKDKSA